MRAKTVKNSINTNGEKDNTILEILEIPWNYIQTAQLYSNSEVVILQYTS